MRIVAIEEIGGRHDSPAGLGEAHRVRPAGNDEPIPFNRVDDSAQCSGNNDQESAIQHKQRSERIPSLLDLRGTQ
jgi:hypothetical protein